MKPNQRTPPKAKIQLTHQDLFGNEVAEDEDEDVFRNSLFRRPELADFSDPQRKLRIVRAYKGEGKSALLRAARLEAERRVGAERIGVIAATAGADISAYRTDSDVAGWSKAWKGGMFAFLAKEVGKAMGFELQDDGASYLDAAEGLGFRRRTFVSLVVDRINAQKVSRIVERPADAETRIAEWSAKSSETELWLFVDDVDRNFDNTDAWRASVAGFLEAVREMTNAIPQLRIRCAIRPNVLTILELHYESLSHIRQYVLDLRWSESDMQTLLARRVEGYLRLTKQSNLILPRQDQMLEHVFTSPVPWGKPKRLVPIHVPLTTLSKHRPRWLIELCKLAAERRHAKGVGQRIELGDIVDEMTTFGERRKKDTVAEFKSQCPEIGELVEAFSGAAPLMRTEHLLEWIEERVLSALNPKIVGVSGNPSSRDVASFLFEVGLFFARVESESERGYRHLMYSERPFLLKSRTEPEEHVMWEIHPVFRQVLGITRAFSLDDLET